MKEMLEKLKAWLKEHQSNYHQHYDMMGDTEGGFYEQDDFDFEALMREIDAFSDSMKDKK